MGNLVYKLDLSVRLRLHLIFHVSLLKKFHEDYEDPILSKSHCATPQVRTRFDKKAEAILDRHIEGIRRHEQNTFYLVQWEGQPLEEAM